MQHCNNSKTAHHYLYPEIIEMAVSKIKIKAAPNNLILPQDKDKLHPLYKNLTVTAVLIQ